VKIGMKPGTVDHQGRESGREEVRLVEKGPVIYFAFSQRFLVIK